MEGAMRNPFKVLLCVVAFGAGLYMAKHHHHAHRSVSVDVATPAQPEASDRAVHMSAQYWPSAFAVQ